MRNKNGIKNNKIAKKQMGLSVMTFCMLLWNCGICCQAANYGENVGNWLLDQFFWIGVAIIGFILVTCILKKSWTTAIITFICGGIILAVIKEPDLISTVGKNIADIILK